MVVVGTAAVIAFLVTSVGVAVAPVLQFVIAKAVLLLWLLLLMMVL